MVTAAEKRPEIILGKAFPKRLKCPFLIKEELYSCTAVVGAYAPTSFQLAEYCTSEHHKKCPFI